MKKFVILFALIAFAALAQSVVIDAPCATPVQTTMVFPIANSADGGNDGGPANAPPTAATARRMIRVCNSKRNLGSPIFTIRIDSDGGQPRPVVNSPGTSLAVGDCDTYMLPSGVPVRAVCDIQDAGLEILECR